MSIAPRHTSVVEVLDTPFGMLVREDYYRYPATESNLYMLDGDGRPIWFAERPLPEDAFSGHIHNIGQSTFSCASWKGVTCEIDFRTGRIAKSSFTK